MAQNGGQKVIKIMCKAARQLSDGLHFLALDKLRLEGFEFSGIT